MKKVLVLGATGSIGTSTLDIIRANPDKFKLAGFSAGSNVKAAIKISEEFPEANKAMLAENNQSIPFGKKAILELIDNCDADIAVNGIAGAAGLQPSIAVINRGIDLALANKETIVTSGRLIFDLANKTGAKILPVDSEHSAIFDLVHNHKPEYIKQIILTASGGAFRDYTIEQLQTADAEAAMNHPTWNMGKKITIDSATMANKGLEVIEAVYLFNTPPEKIDVLIHPHSYVHSLIRTIDGCIYAQISNPDMKHPIQNALTYPDRIPGTSHELDLADKALSFTRPDMQKFPMLKIAFQTASKGNGYTTVYNAANECAVEAYIKNEIKYFDIAGLTEKVLNYNWKADITELSEIKEIDKEARRLFNSELETFKRR